MKNNHHYFKTLFVFCSVILLFNACTKDTTKPSCCNFIPPKNQWLLTAVEFFYAHGAGYNSATRHKFEYNKFNKPWVHREILQLINPEHPSARVDTFYYNDKQQLTQIKSTDLNDSNPGQFSYKEMFSYDGSGRKTNSLKYLLSATNQYLLRDSTVYLYVDTTIWKITYHKTIARIDTAFFTYNQQKNLVRFKLGQYGSDIQELKSYDNQLTPYNYSGMEAFELDPYDGMSYWGIEFLLSMQMPQLSRNNYKLRHAAIDYDYSLGYSSLDSIVGYIYSHLSVGDVEFTQLYEYTPAQ